MVWSGILKIHHESCCHLINTARNQPLEAAFFGAFYLSPLPFPGPAHDATREKQIPSGQQ